MYTAGLNPAVSWAMDGGGPDFGWKPGQVAFAGRGTGWMCVEAASAITKYQAVSLDRAFMGSPLTSALLAANLAQPVGAAGADIPAGEFGWIQIWGPGPLTVSGALSAGASLYSSNTAGALDDSSTGQTRVHRVAPHTAMGAAGTARAFFNWPSGKD